MSNYDPVNALAELLAPKNARARPLNELGFHQGIITAWNATTGENTVVIAGAEIVDVPMLNIGDSTNLDVGATVAVIRYRNAYFIIGRVVLPNSDSFATSAFAFETVFDYANTYTLPDGVLTTVVSYDTVVPPWANFGIINVAINTTARNSLGASDAAFVKIQIDGFFDSATMLTDVPSGMTGYVGTALNTEFFLAPGTTTFPIEGQVRANDGTWAASSLNAATLTGTIIYTRREV